MIGQAHRGPQRRLLLSQQWRTFRYPVRLSSKQCCGSKVIRKSGIDHQSVSELIQKLTQITSRCNCTEPARCANAILVMLFRFSALKVVC
jgi:hypothetical protein